MDSKKQQKNWLHFVREVQAIAQSGLAYVKNPYEKERYDQLLALVSEQYQAMTGLDLSQVKASLQNEQGYATPKLCVRGLCLEGDKVLLVKETANDLWSLPGGWADVNLSPAENMLKEMQEETGFTCRIKRMLALWDKLKHPHPPHWPHTCMVYFWCEKISGEKTVSHEISAIDYFSLNNLPPLCPHRVTEKQIITLIHIAKNNLPVSFD